MGRKTLVAALALSNGWWLPVAADEPAAITAKDVFIHLTRTISWYQHLTAIEGDASTPENLLQRSNVQEFAKSAMQSSFAFARAEATVLSKTGAAAPVENNGNVSQNMQQSLNNAAARVTRLEDKLQNLDAQIDRTGGSKHDTLVAERTAIAADLTLAKQMQTALKGMTSFRAPKSSGSRGLLDQINDLQAVSPISQEPSESQKKQSGSSMASSSGYHPENSGIFTLASKAVEFNDARKRVELGRDETDRLVDDVNQLRTPLRTAVRAIVAASDRISYSADGSMQASDWLNTSKQISDLGTQFKQMSAVMMPLSEMATSLQSVRGALDDWRSALDGEYKSTVRYLAVRLGVLFGGALFILLASAIWQRIIFRYVREPRRRRQFLMVKRVVVGAALALLVTLGFFTSFGAVATLLGFITAGLALALQNVVLSAVAYFFLIGRYGLRVGDRVSVQGVTGQVIEVGLIRLFLMELAGTGTDMHPTGRLAVFANSVIFQPAALMKQAPGMDYAWHAVTATLEGPLDFVQAKERLTGAVQAVYEDYRRTIEQQHAVFERSTDMQTNAPTPMSQAQFSERGFDITIRYPVSMAELGDIDERIVGRLLEEAEKEPKLRFVAGGSPKIAQVV